MCHEYNVQDNSIYNYCSPGFMRELEFYSLLESTCITRTTSWINKTSLEPPLFIEVPVTSQKSDQCYEHNH